MISYADSIHFFRNVFAADPEPNSRLDRKKKGEKQAVDVFCGKVGQSVSTGRTTRDCGEAGAACTGIVARGTFAQFDGAAVKPRWLVAGSW